MTDLTGLSPEELAKKVRKFIPWQHPDHCSPGVACQDHEGTDALDELVCRLEAAEDRVTTLEEALRWIKREADTVVANAPDSPRRLPLALAIANKARDALSKETP